MPAKLTLHPPERASRFLVIRDGETLLVGRDPECGLLLEDGRVSKRHARVRWAGEAWTIEDLGSKNGTSVNGRPAVGQVLADGDWLSFGGLPGRFEHLSEPAARSLESERLARLATSLDLRRRLGAELSPLDLLLRFLESAMEVTRAERGFVLVADAAGRLHAEVAAGLSAEDVLDPRFAGSLGALARARETRAAVVVSDAQRDPYLGRRPSVVSQHLGTLACVPLGREEPLLGLLYVDSRRPGAGFTALDLEILEALAEHTALVIAGLRIDRRIRELRQRAPAGGERGALEALDRRIGAATAAPGPAV